MITVENLTQHLPSLVILNPGGVPERGTFFRVQVRKIPKISPAAYIFQRPFLRGLFLEGLIFGGAYLRREICVSNSIALAL